MLGCLDIGVTKSLVSEVADIRHDSFASAMNVLGRLFLTCLKPLTLFAAQNMLGEIRSVVLFLHIVLLHVRLITIITSLNCKRIVQLVIRKIFVVQISERMFALEDDEDEKLCRIRGDFGLKSPQYLTSKDNF